VTACGANSPHSPASSAIRIFQSNEVDRFPPTPASELDPVNLGKLRAATFFNRKFILVSTPTVKDLSWMEAAYLESDQRVFKVPCKDCGEKQELKWSNVTWNENDYRTAKYSCDHCGSIWDDVDRTRAISKGEWYATKPFNKSAGFRLNGLYSPWLRLEDAVFDFLEAKKMPETLKTWVNTFLGETWIETGDRMDDNVLYQRREKYTMPRDVVVITAGVDVQDDRLEVSPRPCASVKS
jgi:Bacteriophage tail assembly protein